MIKSPNEIPVKGKAIGVVITFLVLVVTLLVCPHDVTNVLFKACLVTFGLVLSQVADKIMHQRVDEDAVAEAMKNGTLEEKLLAVELTKAIMIRKALVTVAIVLGLGLGL